MVLWAHEQRLYPDYTPRRPAIGEPRPGNTPTSMPVPPMRPALTISGLARVRSFGRCCRWATASGADRHACATSPRPPCPNTPVAWSAVIAHRVHAHACTSAHPKSRRDRALLLRPSRVRRRSVTGRDARRRRSVASVPSTTSPGESCSAPSELLAATMAATGARSRWRTGVRRKPQRRRWQCRRVHERYFAQRATCMWSEESV